MGNLISLLSSPVARRFPVALQQMIWNAVQADDEATARRIVTSLMEHRNLMLMNVNEGLADAAARWEPAPELGELQGRLTAGRWTRLQNAVRDMRGGPFPYLSILRSVMWNHPTRANNHIQRHTHLHIEDFVDMAEDVDLEEDDLYRTDLGPIVQRHVSPFPRRRLDD